MRLEELPVDQRDMIASRHRPGDAEHGSLHQSQEIILKRRDLEPPTVFLDLAAQPNWPIRVTMNEIQGSFVEPYPLRENLTEGQSSVQNSTNQAFMEEWPDGSHC